MRYVLFIALFMISATGAADHRMADVAVFINAVWLAEEFNGHCPNSPIEIPVTEVELRKLLALADGGNLVDEVAKTPTMPGFDLRDEMKNIARDAVADGCDSETAAIVRARVTQELVVPDLIKEYQAIMGPN